MNQQTRYFSSLRNGPPNDNVWQVDAAEKQRLINNANYLSVTKLFLNFLSKCE